MTKWVLKLIIRYLRFRSRYVITSLPWKIQQRHKFSDVINYTFNEIFKNPGSEKVNTLLCIGQFIQVSINIAKYTVRKLTSCYPPIHSCNFSIGTLRIRIPLIRTTSWMENLTSQNILTCSLDLLRSLRYFYIYTVYLYAKLFVPLDYGKEYIKDVWESHWTFLLKSNYFKKYCLTTSI